MPGRVDNSGDVVAIGLQIRQYELIRVLGRGGMDVAYAARDTKLGRRVAMKFLGHTAPELARPTR
jgi:serine/threonine protein kinase